MVFNVSSGQFYANCTKYCLHVLHTHDTVRWNYYVGFSCLMLALLIAPYFFFWRSTPPVTVTQVKYIKCGSRTALTCVSSFAACASGVPHPRVLLCYVSVCNRMAHAGSQYAVVGLPYLEVMLGMVQSQFIHGNALLTVRFGVDFLWKLSLRRNWVNDAAEAFFTYDCRRMNNTTAKAVQCVCCTSVGLWKSWP